ncbi:MAG: hypothetical protein JSR82_21430 [Verrucomicrobia bacterium]|nr:hypothetical protein [Verrucomicrobiota bacterium]
MLPPTLAALSPAPLLAEAFSVGLIALAAVLGAVCAFLLMRLAAEKSGRAAADEKARAAEEERDRLRDMLRAAADTAAQQAVLERELEDAKAALQKASVSALDARWLQLVAKLVGSGAHEVNNRLGAAILGSSTLREKIVHFTTKFQTQELLRSDLETFLAQATEATGLVGPNLKRAADLIGGLKQIAADQLPGVSRRFELKSYLTTVAAAVQLVHKHSGLEITVEGVEVPLDHQPALFARIAAEIITLIVERSFGARRGGRIQIATQHLGTRAAVQFVDDGSPLPPDVVQAINQAHLRAHAIPAQLAPLLGLVLDGIGAAIRAGTEAETGRNVIRLESGLEAPRTA